VLAAADFALRATLPPEELLPWMEREFAAYTVKVARFAAAPAPDVLLVGNSRVHDGLVPAVFAEALTQRWGRPASVYNLGLMNAKAAEFAALVRGHFPEPVPRHVIFGISGTEFANVGEFQYASRFLWNGGELLDYLERTPLHDVQRAHVADFLDASLGRLWYAFGERDALRAALENGVRGVLGLPEGPKMVALRAQIGRYNRADVLSPDGTSADETAVPSLATLLSRGEKIRIPPYSLGDASELIEGRDFPLMRQVLGELAARGCRVALVEVPPSPWLQEQCPDFHGELFRQRMAEFAGSLHVPFVAVPPSESFLTDGAYVDANHLNPAGAQRLSTLLVQRLAEAGYFDA